VSPKEHDRVRSGRERAWIGTPLARIAFVTVAVSLIATWSAVARQAGATGRATTTVTHAAPKAPTKAAGKCVNSFDPACGAFHWSPAPGANQPTTTSVSPAELSGVAGKDVSFDTAAADPDAKIACHWILFGDEQVSLIPSVMLHQRYGEWTPPAKQPGDFHQSYIHTYAKPGVYHVQFGARSGDACESNYNPYGGESVATATVTIAAS
jgi:hypothetical protein